MPPDEILAALARLFPPGAVRCVAGRPAVTLADEEEARALASLARERGWRLHAWNGGAPPGRPLPEKVILVTPAARLGGGVAVAAADGYAEAPAALTAAAFSERLRAGTAWFPFAAAGAPAMTLGEVVARYPANAFAPIYGELQRLVLGLTVVDDAGELVPLGRRTIKGVAGYDLAKMFLGARGQTGLVAAVRVRLFGRPADAALWRLGGASAAPAWEGLCRVAVGGDAYVYAEGRAGGLARIGGELRYHGLGVEELARGRAATEEFAALAAAAPAAPPGDGVVPAPSALFV